MGCHAVPLFSKITTYTFWDTFSAGWTPGTTNLMCIVLKQNIQHYMPMSGFELATLWSLAMQTSTCMTAELHAPPPPNSCLKT